MNNSNDSAEELSLVNLYEHLLGLDVGVRVNNVWDVLGHESGSILLHELVELVLSLIHIVIQGLDIVVDGSHFL